MVLIKLKMWRMSRDNDYDDDIFICDGVMVMRMIVR